MCVEHVAPILSPPEALVAIEEILFWRCILKPYHWNPNAFHLTVSIFHFLQFHICFSRCLLHIVSGCSNLLKYHGSFKIITRNGSFFTVFSYLGFHFPGTQNRRDGLWAAFIQRKLYGPEKMLIFSAHGHCTWHPSFSVTLIWKEAKKTGREYHKVWKKRILASGEFSICRLHITDGLYCTKYHRNNGRRSYRIIRGIHVSGKWSWMGRRTVLCDVILLW